MTSLLKKNASASATLELNLSENISSNDDEAYFDPLDDEGLDPLDKEERETEAESLSGTTEEAKSTAEQAAFTATPNDFFNDTDANNKPHYRGHRQRLKERLLLSKKLTLPDYEILEILLFAASPRGDVKPLAKDLISHFGSLSKVIHASQDELKKFPKVNISTMAQLRVVIEAAERLLRSEFKEKPILQSWKALLDYCRASMGHLRKEQFRVLYLDRKNRLITDELQEAGTVDKTPVYPREVIKRALELDCSALILVHNHPSGDVRPSQADVDITNHIIRSAALFDIEVHDHVIISSQQHFSFKTAGIL